VHLVGDGGVEHVYSDAVAANATDVGSASETLKRVAALVQRTPGIAEVLARLPVPGVPTIAGAHPGWRLGHERTGELLLVAAPGYQFVDGGDAVESHLLGNHGGPGEQPVPLVLLGGAAALAAAPPGTAGPSLADVGSTIAMLLGLPGPRRVDGTPVPDSLCGRPITAVLTARTAGSTR